MIVYIMIAFHLWMFVDALVRKAPVYWYFIIWFVPFGSIIYFVVTKLAPHLQSQEFIQSPLQPATQALDELAQTATETPSMVNRLAYAQALLNANSVQHSLDLYAECTKTDPHEPDALYGLASCLSRQNRETEAITVLTRLLAIDRAHQEYAAWLDLAFAHAQLKEQNKAIQVLTQLVRESPRVKHKTILGRYLAEIDKHDQARTILKQAIADYEEASFFLKRHNLEWAKQAHQILESLPLSPSPTI